MDQFGRPVLQLVYGAAEVRIFGMFCFRDGSVVMVITETGVLVKPDPVPFFIHTDFQVPVPFASR